MTSFVVLNRGLRKSCHSYTISWLYSIGASEHPALVGNQVTVVSLRVMPPDDMKLHLQSFMRCRWHPPGRIPDEEKQAYSSTKICYGGTSPKLESMAIPSNSSSPAALLEYRNFYLHNWVGAEYFTSLAGLYRSRKDLSSWHLARHIM